MIKRKSIAYYKAKPFNTTSVTTAEYRRIIASQESKLLKKIKEL